MKTSLPSRVIVAGVAAIAVLATACGGTSPDTTAIEPADDQADVAGDPDLDTGEDPDGGVLEVPDEEDDSATPVVVPDTGSEGSPTAKPPVTKPVAKPAVAKPAAKPAVKPVAKPVPGTDVLADGSYEGRLVSIDRRTVTLGLIEVLTGQAAIDAAKAAGALDPDGTLPNDVFVKDLRRTVTLPVAGDGGFQVYDCSAGCALVGTTLEALASGTGSPYGGANAPFSFRVDGGTVISLIEIYLP